MPMCSAVCIQGQYGGVEAYLKLTHASAVGGYVGDSGTRTLYSMLRIIEAVGQDNSSMEWRVWDYYLTSCASTSWTVRSDNVHVDNLFKGEWMSQLNECVCRLKPKMHGHLSSGRQWGRIHFIDVLCWNITGLFIFIIMSQVIQLFWSNLEGFHTILKSFVDLGRCCFLQFSLGGCAYYGDFLVYLIETMDLIAELTLQYWKIVLKQKGLT